LEPAWEVRAFLRNLILAALSPDEELRQAKASAATPIAAPAIRSRK
jgi:hypothetical protein